MEITFTDLRRLLELWAAWYSIGVDGWLASDESVHVCSLDFTHSTHPNSASTQPPYPPDPALDALFLRGINEIGLQCSRLGSISFSRTGTGTEITTVGEPIVALIEGEQTFFTGKRLSIFSELRRDYGDFGSHTMALDLALEAGHVTIYGSSLEMNNRRRGLKLELWEPLTNALAAYADILEQGAALGYSFVDLSGDLSNTEDESGNINEALVDDAAGETEVEEDTEGAESAELSSEEVFRQRQAGLPFPCLSLTEASHLARLSSHVAPMHRALADGTTLLSTHPLRELAALITYVRFCEPLGAMQRV